MVLKLSTTTTIKHSLLFGGFLAILFGCTCVALRPAAPQVSLDDSYRLGLAKGFELDNDLYEQVIATFTTAPHPFGSARQSYIADYLVKNLERLDPTGTTIRQEFVAKTPNPRALHSGSLPVPLTLEKTGWNIIHHFALAVEPTCAVILGSHYDTKIVEGIDYVGANDSGSSSVLLLSIISWLQQNKVDLAVGTTDWYCDLIFVWFDGEESILPGWFDGLLAHPAKIQDNTYGSRYLVSQLKPCSQQKHCLPSSLQNLPIRAVIVADMIGHSQLRFTNDTHSHRGLREMFVDSAKNLGYLSHISQVPREIEDDHLPFVRAKIPAMVAIDFENISTWHAAGDYPENLSVSSIAITGRIINNLALSLAAVPKVNLDYSEK